MTSAFPYPQLTAFLDRSDLNHEFSDEMQALHLAFGREDGVVHVVLRADEDTLQAYFQPVNRVPETFRTAVAQAVARANFGLQIGGFELHVASGELRYHIGVPIDEDFLSDAVLHRILSAGLSTLDRYLPAVLAIVYGGRDVVEAIRDVERDLTDDAIDDPPPGLG